MNNLKKLINDKGLTQGKVSRMADIPQSNFSLICNNKGYVPPAWKKRIALVLNVREEEVFPADE
ncbi:MAG: helix-turn-helix transcriptional regulator [Desulfitobacterium sp.]